MGKEIAVELKNDVALTGTLHSVDQYLNVKLTDVHVVDAERYPQLVSGLMGPGWGETKYRWRDIIDIL